MNDITKIIQLCITTIVFNNADLYFTVYRKNTVL